MSDCKYLKKIKGRVVGHVYLIDGLEMSQCQALEYLENQNFTRDEAHLYLNNLKTDDVLVNS